MKNNLLVLVATMAATTVSLSAQTLLSPNYSGTGTPPGFTSVTSGGGTNTFPGNGTQVSGDFSTPGTSEYISGTYATPNTMSYNISTTFTPSYSSEKMGGDYLDIPIFGVGTTGGGNDLVSLDMVFNSFVDTAQFQVSGGVEYSGSTTPIDYTAPGGLDGLNHTYTFSDKLTWSFTPPAPGVFSVPVVLTNVGTISEGGVVVYSFDLVSNGNTVNGDSFEPGTNPVTLQVGPRGSGDMGFFDPGATITYSAANLSTPEPSTYAMLLGGLGLLALVVRRRLVA